MDWEGVRNVFIQFLQENLELLEENTGEFLKKFLERLKEKGYVLSEEEEKEILEWAQEQILFVEGMIQQTAGIVSVAVFGEMRDEFVADIARRAFERRYPDGLTLSTRLWDWKEELKQGLKRVLANAIYAGKGANEVMYELQYAIESITGREYEITLKEKLPEWVEKLRESAKGLIKNPQMREMWERTVAEAERKIEKLSRTRSKVSARRLLEEIKKAVEKGREELIEEAIKWFVYDRQLSRLKTIAQTETANAFHEAQILVTEKDENIIGYRWRLSRSHPRPDVCDLYANVNFGLGRGVWPKDKVPRIKPHPHCLCYLVPVVRKREHRKVEEKAELPEDVLRKIAPQYIRDLEALGFDIKKLWSFELNAFVRKKDLVRKVGERDFKVLQSIGKTIRKGEWKENVKTKYLLNDLIDSFGSPDKFPEEVKRIIKDKKEINSLLLHYIKRKYLDRWDLKGPKELDEIFVKHLRNPEAVVYLQGDRIAVEHGRFVAIIHPPNTKITIFELKDRYRDYEDYAKQRGIPILKLWQLKDILRKL